ncbi:FAD binding domain-containing protein [Cryphonectria parasitica EP155]|uniref:FAD binding domain-containing protein n=1 Tax=Cryphonectria parasitica (strain ATCC 38755 / EP155) TaxID=660469 RepID=A0A9P5CPM7_CRYP1|nr:FAD binding domain-containing protein [Cryphonectria parasitica EP155]KAF3766639.1 FAD binding domain-containing protein [Cryphonectria parasitica EP155]
MALRILSLFLSTLSIAHGLTAAVLNGTSPQSCRFLPGDEGWPNEEIWARLNMTVGGRLLLTVPVAHVCHREGLFATYDQVACEALQTACPVPGEIFNPFWQNQSCSPFTAPGVACELGNRAVYSINVTGPADVQAGLRFAKENHVRLVIRNTGIDYLGKSTGSGALALWTYSLKSTEIISNYTGPQYSGPAIKLGAGVIAGEAYEVVQEAGYRMVAPECGLTGVVGGYAQGGGQSQLVTAYGLAADQVLEWEVVTPRGDYVVATPENKSDLYWALAGGGGGTYGVVLSATFKVYPEGPVAGGTMTVSSDNTTALFEAIGVWYSLAPSFVNTSRNNIQAFVTNDTLDILNFVMPDQNSSSINDLLSPFLLELGRLGLSYELNTTEYPSYLDSFIASYGPLPYGDLCPSYPVIGSRLIPRDIVLDPTTNQRLMDLYRNITEGGTWWIGCSFLNVDNSPGSPRPSHPPNAVHPAWRDAVAYCNPQTHEAYDWSDPTDESVLRRTLVDDIFPALEAATPGGAVLNEIDPTYRGDWKEAFYGSNYDRLLQIKHDYDPDYLMYGLYAVGSDEFVMQSGGRLCVA